MKDCGSVGSVKVALTPPWHGVGVGEELLSVDGQNVHMIEGRTELVGEVRVVTVVTVVTVVRQ